MDKIKYANIIVNVASSNVDKVFEYAIPNEMIPFIKIGSRVKIPFGQSDRLIHGFVVDIHDEKQYHEGSIKELEEVPDLEPVINKEQFELAKYLQKTTFSPIVRILNAMIPEALKMRTSKVLHIYDLEKIDASLVELFEGKSTININKSHLKEANKIKKLIDNNLAEVTYEASDNKTFKYINVYKLNKYLDIKEIDKKLIEIIEKLNPNLEYEKVDLANLGITNTTINKLINKKVLSKISISKKRILERNYNIDDYYYRNNSSSDAIKFYNFYLDCRKRQKNSMLWIPKDDIEIVQGISFAIIENLKKSKTTIITTPEILSSFKFADLIKKYLDIPVLCINSSLSSGELLDCYYSILNNEYKVIVTTPIAILWPYQNIETIFVLDEESMQYYNDQSPRYDAKDVLMKRSIMSNATIVYTSFAPDLEYYNKAITSKLAMIDNAKYLDFNKTKHDEDIEIVDMTNQYRLGNISPISESLDNAIRNNLSKNELILLILNNKGYSDFVICRKCGHVEKCERCKISYKYRDKDKKLVCPSCGKSKSYNQICSNCSSNTVKYMGLGAEKLKEYLEKNYTKNNKVVNVTIIDDPKYNNFKKQVESMENNEIDIVIATDTYSRGLSTSKISLVGILSIDLVLKTPGYKSNQRAYEMLTHAKRNLTRNNNVNKMIIQTYNIDNFVLKCFVNNDYYSYFRQEMNYRYTLSAPPYFNINKIIVKGEYGDIFKKANEIVRQLRMTKLNIIVNGPTYNYTEQGVQIIIKHRLDNIDEIYEKLYNKYKEDKVVVIFDKFPRAIV